VKSLEHLKALTYRLIQGAPIPNIFPPEPWSEDDIDDIARIIEDFVNTSTDVIEDDNQWKDWLDRYRFYKAQKVIYIEQSAL
jgi:hypothetical protein